MLPILLRHDHERFEICVYHTGSMFDKYTRQAREKSNHWISTNRWTDAELCETIIRDEVDILVDLAGHTASHRLGVMAMGAAPVQASYLGYPHSTGLTSIDWLIGDALVAPTEHGHLFSEGIAKLSGCVFCWAPVDKCPPPPARPAGASVAFGSFNNAAKLGPTTV